MTGKADPDFWQCFDRLPRDVQALARKKYRLWSKEPFHSSLRFKQLTGGLWSVRINMQYRAMGRRIDDHVTWFWIGPHAEYDRLIK